MQNKCADTASLTSRPLGMIALSNPSVRNFLSSITGVGCWVSLLGFRILTGGVALSNVNRVVLTGLGDRDARRDGGLGVRMGRLEKTVWEEVRVLEESRLRGVEATEAAS